MVETVKKHSYTVPCSSGLRDAAMALAARRHVNVADLARSVLLTVPPGDLEAFPDPGEPEPGDRETITLKSGPAKGRPWRRKPRLQIRMAPGQEVSAIRRALALALALDAGDMHLKVEAVGSAEAPETIPARRGEIAGNDHPPAANDEETGRDAELLRQKEEELDRLRAMVSALSFDPLPHGIHTRDEALHVLGFAPGERPDRREIRSRFRILATIHHPDGEYGSHQRMSQLNAAMEILRSDAA